MNAKITFEVEIDNDDMIFLKHCDIDKAWGDILDFLCEKIPDLDKIELKFEE